MRLRQRDLKEYIVKKHGSFKEPDGTKFTGYEQEGQIVKAKIQPAGGKNLSEMYGLRLANMQTMLMEDSVLAREMDIQFNSEKQQYGVCVYRNAEQDPDFKIVAIRPWNSHLVADLERR
ncbi:hypothetical protein [Tissierella sp. Yu-01]|uniref:hypothetical protein n=1 Tax=Tissierella sp. Yu-01 TaxID=3035694 RepID=UPI00240DB22A|nr:hypothetical protein [Tissierella sp. Yu-01]WFA10335.1 hypothetical protein P3962_07225 [Tissierella sp. Yu-01]